MSGVYLASELLMYILYGHVPPERLIRITEKCLPESRHGWPPQICGYGLPGCDDLVNSECEKNWQ